MKKRTLVGNFLFLLLLAPILCFGQQSFLQVAETRIDKMEATSQVRLKSIQQSPFTADWTLVTFNDLRIISDSEGAFLLKVPNAPYEYTVRPDIHQLNSTDPNFWSGKVYNSVGGEEGDLMLTFNKKKVAGHFETYHATYEIIPLGENLSILQELDAHELAKTSCNIAHLDDEHPELSETLIPGDKSMMCDVTILVVYNTTTEIQGANAQSIANTSIYQTNLALDNSNLSTDVILVGVEQIAMPTTGDPDDDLESLSMDPETNSLRAQYNADIVIMLTNSNYGGVAGIAYRNALANTAYGLVQVDNATSTYTFSHETFHIFGCRHQQCYITQSSSCVQGSSPPGFRYGYKYTRMMPIPIFPGVVPVIETTNLHTLESPNRRRLRVSNPDIILDTAPTGIEDENDNARVIENIACTAANWGTTFTTTNPLPLTASISGPCWGYDGQSITLTSTVTGGTPPYTYNWEVSSNGTNYWSVGNSANLTYQLWFPGPSKILFFRLTVTSSDGQTIVVRKNVLVFLRFGKLLAEDPNSAMILNNYPNPANDATTIEYILQDPTQVVLELLDQNGRVLSVLEKGEFSAGRYTVPVDLSNLSSGTYYYQLKTDDNIATNSLIINK